MSHAHTGRPSPYEHPPWGGLSFPSDQPRRIAGKAAAGGDPFEHYCIMVVAPEAYNDLMAILREDVERVRSEDPSCFSFRVGKKTGEPYAITLRSTWATAEAFEAHRHGGSYRVWAEFARDPRRLLHMNEVATSEALLNLDA